MTKTMKTALIAVGLLVLAGCEKQSNRQPPADPPDTWSIGGICADGKPSLTLVERDKYTDAVVGVGVDCTPGRFKGRKIPGNKDL